MLRKLGVLAAIMASLGVAFVLFQWPREWWPHIVIVPLGAAVAVFAAPLVYVVFALAIAPEIALALLQDGVRKLYGWLARRRGA